MGNTQSNAKGESGNEGQNGGGGNDQTSKLSRFNTGLSSDSSSGFQSLAPNVSPQLRRLSTTATGSAAHHERSHRKRGISYGGSNLSPVSTNEEGGGGGVGGSGSANLLRAISSDRRASASASSSPRTLEREQAWIRSALPGGGSTRTAPSTSSNRNRSRSGSIGNLLSGGSSRKSSVRANSANQNDGATGTFTPAGGRGSELVFRRKKSIELSDLDTGLTFSGTEPSGGITSPSPPHRQSSQDSTTLLSPGGTDASHTSNSSASRLRSVSSPIDDGSTEGSSFSHAGAGYDTYNPMFPFRGGTKNDASATSSNTSSIKDPLGRKQPTALPSYLKIPTLIPSAYASPTSSEPSSPHMADRVTMDQEYGSSFEGQPLSTSQQLTPAMSTQTNRHALGGSAAVAILNTEDVLIAPGEAGKVSSPLMEDADSSQDTESSKAVTASFSKDDPADRTSTSDRSIAATISSTASDPSVDQRQNTSRTPTPTPGSMGSGRAMTPTEARPGGLSSLSASKSTEAVRLAQAALAASNSDHTRRPSLQLYTGTESGAATPALPIGLTSAPSSAFTPAIPTYGTDQNIDSSPTTPLTKETNNLKLTLPETTPTAKEPLKGHSLPTPPKGEGRTQNKITSPSHQRQSSVPLIPIVVQWRGGGKEVFVTGTFANEWRSKILLRKNPTSSGKRPEYSCVLHLAPGTHRLKFIVDDRWRVSRDLSTASDGEGNLTNYIEVAHTGPAHPGPLSAPGEDLLAPLEEEEEKRKKQGLSAHKAATDLVEEARRAEALQRGNLLDVFGEDKVRHEERWTQEIPPSIVKAQASEENYRNELEVFQTNSENKSSNRSHHTRDAPLPPNDVPVPPTLPRQLEKVILNSTSAAVLGTVDDNSVLPAPNHAVLHHLTASAIKSGVIATGCTVRYRKKYITTVYYRAAS